MEHKKRVEMAFSNKKPDRTPIFEYVILGEIGSLLLNRKYRYFDGEGGEFYEYAKEVGLKNALRQYAKDKVELCKILGHDLMYLVPNPVLGGNHVSINVLEEPMGNAEQPEKAVSVRNEQRRQALHKNLLEPDESFLVYEYIQKEMKRMEYEIDIFAPDYFHGVWTDTSIMQTMLLDEDIAKEHFEICTQIALLRMKKLSEFNIRILGIGGDFSGTRPLISPACYKKYIVPEVSKCSKNAHKYGMWTVNASDGDLWSVIDDFLIGCEVDGYMEIDKSAGMDLKKLKEAYKSNITFMGNMDCGTVLSYFSQEEIKKQTIECLDAGIEGRHIFTASNAITSSVSLENYLTMVNTYKDYFNLKRVKSSN